MNSDQTNYRRVLSWLSLALLVVLVCVLGVLQYRWIGEISQIEKKKLQDYLQSSLNEVSRDFSAELNRGCAALLPADADVQQLGREQAYQQRYSQWKNSSSDSKLFGQIALAWEQSGQLTLRKLNLESGRFASADWPAEWNQLKERISARLRREPSDPRAMDDSALIDIPRFGGAPGEFHQAGERPGEQDWLILEVDRRYVAGSLLPELLTRHFGNDFQSEYQIELVTRTRPLEMIYPLDSGLHRLDRPDSSVALFDVFPRMPDGMGGRPGRPRPFGPGRGFPPPGESGRGRWQLSVGLKSGSLEAVVSRARARNLGISAAILLLILGSAIALVRFTRQAQRLAEMEMEFVAGVSHELRTPLTVIRTAAFNLRGRLSGNPDQVETYGALIQQQSEKLTAIVEQVLRFASARTGRVIRERAPVSVESLIEDSLESSRGLLEEHSYEVEKQVESGLPLIAGDSVALRHAIQNLIDNVLKYGMEGGNWIGVFAMSIAGPRGAMVEIRVADRGPGIPAEERKHIFDAFFRGKRAVRDQIHGTGLGLNLVKKIVEAHGGMIDVESEPGVGTTFIVRLPVQPAEREDELAHSLG